MQLRRRPGQRLRLSCKVSPTDGGREDGVEVISVEEHLGINADEHQTGCCWPKQRELPLENMADADDALDSIALDAESQRFVADVASSRLVSVATIVR